MWPRRACLVGGRASDKTSNYTEFGAGTNMQPGSIPSTIAAWGVWASHESAYYLNNSFHGLEWPTVKDPNFANVQVCWHGNYNGTTSAAGSGNMRMLPTARKPSDCVGFESVIAADGGLGQYVRRGGLYSLKGPNGSVTHNVTANITLGSGNFTLEGWLYCTDNTVGSSIWDCRGASGANAYPFILLNATSPNFGKLTYNRGTTANLIMDSAAISTNVWHHFALCRDSGTIYLYKDGVSIGSVADSTNFATNNTWRIGLNVGATVRFHGYLDEFRATCGTAVYPGGTTFTVPSGQFPDY